MSARLLFPTLIVLAACAGNVAAEPVIHLIYEERPPYLVSKGDQVDGLVGTPANTAFRTAGVPFVWELGSQSRLLHLLRENIVPVCGPSLFKTAERMAFAKFTKPIYRDHPIVALVRRQFVFGTRSAVADVLAAPGLRLLLRTQYSYGPQIDALLKAINPATISSPLHNVQLVDLLQADRADMLFAAQEEAELLLRDEAASHGAVRMLRFSDAVPGQERHIACSRNVPDEVIERLNKGIAFK